MCVHAYTPPGWWKSTKNNINTEDKVEIFIDTPSRHNKNHPDISIKIIDIDKILIYSCGIIIS